MIRYFYHKIEIIRDFFNIILPSMLRSSKWSLSIRFHHQYHVPYLLHVPPISLPAEEHETNTASSLTSFYCLENPKIFGKSVLGIKNNVPSQHFFASNSISRVKDDRWPAKCHVLMPDININLVKLCSGVVT